MNHTKDEMLKLAKLMAERIVKHANHCKYDEYESEEVKHHEIDQIVSMAETFIADDKAVVDTSDAARLVC